MEKVILNALERPTGHKRFREEGFIAGVIYGDSVKEATSVKFELMPLKKILGKHGSNAKVWVNYLEDSKFGFIKEIQRDPVTAKITHIDVQLVSKDHEIKLQLPIAFKGEENLIDNLLELKIYKSEIDVFGSMALMPDSVSIDVAHRKLGDTITIKDFNLDKQIKVTDKEDVVYAAVMEFKEELNIEEDVVEDVVADVAATEEEATETK